MTFTLSLLTLLSPFLVFRHTTSGARKADQILLVPSGDIIRVSSQLASVSVDTSDSPGAHINYHRYEIHPRFQDLQASSKAARLQLAAIYAACSTLVPERTSGMTGAQTAMRLLRQCWSNIPVTDEEHRHLSKVEELGGHLAAGLRLLAHDLRSSSSEVSFLYADNACVDPPPVLHEGAATCYLQEIQHSHHQAWVSNPKMELSEMEERRLMGGMVSVKKANLNDEWRRRGRLQCREIDPPSPECLRLVQDIEGEILQCITSVPNSEAMSPFPFTEIERETPLADEMHKELVQSWEAFTSCPNYRLALDLPSLQDRVKKWQEKASSARACLQEYLSQSLILIPSPLEGIGERGPVIVRMLRAADIAPLPSLRDIASSVLHPASFLRRFNPFLTDASCERFRAGAISWLELCVLEDRLDRISDLASAAYDLDDPTLIREMRVSRAGWSSTENPDWLLFEAEGQLQVRPHQVFLLKHLMRNLGAIDQLNMGEGKTRVILPLLVLSLTRKASSEPVLVSIRDIIHRSMTC